VNFRRDRQGAVSGLHLPASAPGALPALWLTTPTGVITTLVSAGLVLGLLPPHPVGVALLFVGFGGIGGAWYRFQHANRLQGNVWRAVSRLPELRHWWLFWPGVAGHLPMILVGLWLIL